MLGVTGCDWEGCADWEDCEGVEDWDDCEGVEDCALDWSPSPVPSSLDTAGACEGEGVLELA
jgi:hypothetical protein